MAELRDEVQALQALTRNGRDKSILLNALRNGPPKDVEDTKVYVWNHTWDWPHPLEELANIVQDVQQASNTLTPKVASLLSAGVQRANAAGVQLSLPSPAPSMADLLRTCSLHSLNPSKFAGRPAISFMLQYFKRAWMIEPLIKSIKACVDSAGIVAELLVNVDNPDDSEAWVHAAHDTAGFVVPVFSNNVHEARGYNRLASMARGKVLLIMQDDATIDVGADQCSWLRNTLTLFERFPKVAIVGLATYIFGHGPGFKQEAGLGSWFHDPTTKIPAQFVLAVDFAPMAIRRSALLHVGGLDEEMSEPGECAIIGDHELSNRMWATGFQVMWMPGARITRDAKAEGGTHRPEVAERCWGRQMRTGVGFYFRRYGAWDSPVMRGMADHAKEANRDNLEPWGSLWRSGGEDVCPYPTGCEGFKLQG